MHKTTMTPGKDMIGGVSSHSGLFVDNVSYKDGLNSINFAL